jgi:hypothetical protein
MRRSLGGAAHLWMTKIRAAAEIWFSHPNHWDFEAIFSGIPKA